jgi:chemotaxis protein MotB
MKPKLKPKFLEAERGAQRERWLISYTDFITILLILFVAIAAQGMHSAQAPIQPLAKPAVGRLEAKPQPNPEATPDPEVKPNPEVKEVKKDDSRHVLAAAEQKLKQEGLDSRLEKRGLVISLPQAILFPSGEDHVLPSAYPVVSQIAEVLASVPNKVALVGHADSIPIHNKRFQSNWELSAARSVNLLEVLSDRFGISESRLSVQSYGSIDPKDSNDTEAGRAENRRVEILLLDESAE